MKYVRKAESRKIRLDHLKMELGITTSRGQAVGRREVRANALMTGGWRCDLLTLAPSHPETLMALLRGEEGIRKEEKRCSK